MDDDEEEWLEEIHIEHDLQETTAVEVCDVCREFKDYFARSFLNLECLSVTKYHIE